MPGTARLLSAHLLRSRLVRSIARVAMASCVVAASSMACRRDAPTGDLTSPDESTSEWMAPMLDDDPVSLVVPTYEGTGQSVHPDIVAFSEPWNGSKMWMTMTPYPFAEVKFENPSLLVTDDGFSLNVPAGVVNPIVAPPGVPAYNSDPDLTFDDRLGELVLSFRVVKDGLNTIKIMTSTNGRTWTEPRTAFSERAHSAVSQTMVPATGRVPAMVWYVDAGTSGCKAGSTRVMMRMATTSNSSLGRTEWSRAVATDMAQPGYNIWHLKVRYVPSKREYWALIVAYPADGGGCGGDDLFLAHSKDGLHWSGFRQPILRHEDRSWTRQALYRGSFLYDPDTDQLSMWFSARSEVGVWRMGFARFRYQALQGQMSQPAAVDRVPASESRVVWTQAP